MAKRSTEQPSGKATLYNFLLNEVLASQLGEGYMFWVVAPYVKDFALPTSHHVSFREIVAVRHEQLQLFDVLHQIAVNGGQVRITTGPKQEYHPALHQLAGRNPRIAIRVYPSLHAKAYVGRFGALDGSLNLTHSGLNQNVEFYDYRFDSRSIAELREKCRDLFERAVAL